MVTEHKRMRQLQALDGEWSATDPILLDGEIAFSSDSLRFKVGPGQWSTLPYWIAQAPEDGLNYGQKAGVFHPTVNYTNTYAGDLNAVPDDNVTFLKLVAPIQNGWTGAGTGNDYLMHTSDGDNNAIQIGYAWTAAPDASTVLKTRVKRAGSWADWLSYSAHSEPLYGGNLDLLAVSASAYSLSVTLGASVSNGWPQVGENDVVLTYNTDANTARQVGFGYSTNVVMLRSKTGGVWSEWSRHTHVEEDVLDLRRTGWRGNWVEGTTYDQYDQVLDNPYLMIANKTTTDRPAPVDVGAAAWDLPDVPTWDTNGQFTGVVWSGVEYTINQFTEVQGYAVWAPTLTPDTEYVVRLYSYPVSDPTDVTYRQVPEPLLTDDGWTIVQADTITVLPGTVLGVVIDALNSGDSTTGTGGWTRAANNQTDADPGASNWTTNNAEAVLRINNTDLDTTDRGTELMGIVAGATVTIVEVGAPERSMTWGIGADPTDQGGWTLWSAVTYEGQGSGGEPVVGNPCNINWDVPVASPTDYKRDADGNALRALPTGVTSRGLLRLGGVLQAADDQAFGVRAVFQEKTVSADWDYQAGLGGSGGGGSGGGGATSFTGLNDTPIDYATHGGKTVMVKTAEDGLEFLTAPAIITEFTGLTDTPASYVGHSGKVVSVAPGGAGLEFVTPGEVKNLAIQADDTKGTTGGGVAPDQAAAALNGTDYSTFTGNDPGTWTQTQAETGMVRIDPNNSVSVAFDGTLYSYVGPRNVFVGAVPGGGHVIPPEYSTYVEYVTTASDFVALATSDHGLLIGLDHDDHPQYLTGARADGEYLRLDATNDPVTSEIHVDINDNSSFALLADNGQYGTLGAGGQLRLQRSATEYLEFHVSTARYTTVSDGGNAESARFDARGSSLTGGRSIITREKGDARYVELSGDTMLGELTLEANLNIGANIQSDTTDSLVAISGSSTSNHSGGALWLFGEAHPTKGSAVEFYKDTSLVASVDAAGPATSSGFTVLTREKGDARYSPAKRAFVWASETGGPNSGPLHLDTVDYDSVGLTVAAHTVTIPAGKYLLRASGVMRITSTIAQNETASMSVLINGGARTETGFRGKDVGVGGTAVLTVYVDEPTPFDVQLTWSRENSNWTQSTSVINAGTIHYAELEIEGLE